MAKRDRFLDVLGPDVLRWGLELSRQVSPLYDPPTAAHTELPPRAQPTTPKLSVPRVFKDSNGNIMKCIVCGYEKTFDGRYCPFHKPEAV